MFSVEFTFYEYMGDEITFKSLPAVMDITIC